MAALLFRNRMRLILLTALALFFFQSATCFGQVNATPRVSRQSITPQDFSAYIQANASKQKLDYAAKANTFFFFEDFETTAIYTAPAGWQKSTLGTDSAFTVGTAGTAFTQANFGGYWPVPAHGKFIMSNDDVCNCDKSEELLQLPEFDFTGKSGLLLSFEIYDDGLFGSLPTTVEMSVNNGAWDTILQVEHAIDWQYYRQPLTTADNQASVKIRFRWNDNGFHASGVALDNIGIGTQPDFDVSIASIFRKNATDNFYTDFLSNESHYQAFYDTITPGIHIKNLGNKPIDSLHVNFTIEGENGTQNQSTFFPLALQADTVVYFITSYTRYFDGATSITATLSHDSLDTNPKDNELTALIGNSESQLRYFENAPKLGFWYGANARYALATRFELAATDTIESIDVYFMTGTKVGSNISYKIYNDNFLPIYQSPFPEQVAASEINTWKSFPVNTSLVSGRYYIAFQTSVVDSVITGGYPKTPFTKTVAKADPNVFNNWQNIDFVPAMRITTKSRSCALDISALPTHPSCGIADGSISITSTGNNGTQNYLWNNLLIGNSALAQNLTVGSYAVTTTDNLGCADTASIALINQNAPTVAATLVEVLCNGESNGEIALEIAGGSAPYTVNWIGPNGFNSTQQDLTNLQGGLYTLLLTDNANCSVLQTFEVMEYAPLALELVPDYDQVYASITAEVTGGKPNYAYNWSGPQGYAAYIQTIELLDNTGLYSVDVTDQNGCTVSAEQQINNVGTEEVATNDFNIKIYPNPAADLLHFLCKAPFSLELLNTSGQIVRSFSESANCIDISDLSSGIYVARIYHLDGIYTSKISIQH